MNIIEIQFDHLNLDENSKIFLENNNYFFKIIPTITNINVNGDDIG